MFSLPELGQCSSFSEHRFCGVELFQSSVRSSQDKASKFPFNKSQKNFNDVTILTKIPKELKTIIDSYLKAVNGVICRPYTYYNKNNLAICQPIRVMDDSTENGGFVREIKYKH